MDRANLNRPQYSMAGLDLIRKMQGDFPVFFWGLCSFLKDFSWRFRDLTVLLGWITIFLNRGLSLVVRQAAAAGSGLRIANVRAGKCNPSKTPPLRVFLDSAESDALFGAEKQFEYWGRSFGTKRWGGLMSRSADHSYADGDRNREFCDQWRKNEANCSRSAASGRTASKTPKRCSQKLARTHGGTTADFAANARSLPG